jgi:hypothetical protein
MTGDDAWLDRLKQTMSVDIARFAGLPAEAIVEKLMEIPEVEQAFRMRADRRKVPPAVILLTLTRGGRATPGGA